MKSWEKEPKENLEKSHNPFENINFIGKLFFLWILPIVKVYIV